MQEEPLFGFSQKQLQGLGDAVRSALGDGFTIAQKEFEISHPNVSPAMAIHAKYQGLPNGGISAFKEGSIQLNSNAAVQNIPGMDGSNSLAQQYSMLHYSKTTSTMPVAIVGMSCRFPGGANSPQEMWRLCSAGHSAWSKIPKSRFNADAFYHPNPERISSVRPCSLQKVRCYRLNV